MYLDLENQLWGVLIIAKDCQLKNHLTTSIVGSMFVYIWLYICVWISFKTFRWWLTAKLHWKMQASGAIMDPSRRNIFSLSFCKIKDHVSKYKGDPHLYPCKVHLVTGGETWMRHMGCKSTILRLYTRFLLLTCSTDLGQQLKQVIIIVRHFSLAITGFCLMWISFLWWLPEIYPLDFFYGFGLTLLEESIRLRLQAST